MDLFEILFIALFILIPLFEGLLRRGRTREPAPGSEPGSEGPGRVGPEGGPEGGRELERAGARDSSGPAADMVPEDLWELLTGERRPRTTTEAEPLPEPAPGSWEAEPWSTEPAWSPESEEPVVEERSGWRQRSEARGWGEEPLGSSEPRRLPESEPVSLEYVGPEAYSLEQPLPPPDVRHARFHEVIDRVPPPRPARTSSLLKSLRGPRGLRDAVVLSEVLGRPKGLD